MSLNEEPIYLMGSHKSGSSLLRSLLDGHPSLAVLPSETHFFQYARYWVDYPLRKNRPAALSLAERARELDRFMKEENTCNDPYGASRMAGSYDPGRFREVMNRYDGEGLKELFCVYMEAVLHSLNGIEDWGGKRIVEKSVENAEYAFVLKSLFPEAKFVHIVRNPYSCLVSTRKAWSQGGYPYLRDIVESLHGSYVSLARNVMGISGYLVIKYEDLVREPEKTMRQISEFIGVPFDPVLLQPTVLGTPWEGNSTSGKRYSGISGDALNSWKDSITDMEINFVNSRLGPALDLFGYERQSPRHHRLRQMWEPAKGERPAAYLRNRFLYFVSCL